jgi:hypothetical protein
MMRNFVLAVLSIPLYSQAPVWVYPAKPGTPDCKIVRNDVELKNQLVSKGVPRESMSRFPDVRWKESQLAAVVLRPRAAATVPSSGFVVYVKGGVTLQFASGSTDPRHIVVVAALDGKQMGGTACTVVDLPMTVQKAYPGRTVTRSVK